MPSFRSQRRMMQALHGKGDTDEAFPYFLAEHLHKTVREIQDMDHDEYVGWISYITAKNAKLGER